MIKKWWHFYQTICWYGGDESRHDWYYTLMILDIKTINSSYQQGAAAVVSSVWGAAKLKLPINIIALTPLCENMPSGHATKPGDVLTAMNGTTVEVIRYIQYGTRSAS